MNGGICGALQAQSPNYFSVITEKTLVYMQQIVLNLVCSLCKLPRVRVAISSSCSVLHLFATVFVVKIKFQTIR